MKLRLTSPLLILVLISASTASAQNTNLYWGDTHLHTSYSFDAYNWGNTNANPDEAYRFAKGLPVIHPALGNRIQLRRPLDFLVVSDHAENFGYGAPTDVGGRGAGPAPGTAEALPAAPGTVGIGGARGARGGAAAPAQRGGAAAPAQRGGAAAPAQRGGAAAPGTRGGGAAAPAPRGGAAPAARGGAAGTGAQGAAPALLQAAWPLYVDAAEKHNQPGKFTTFVGWEWTSFSGSGNLHRVVFTPAGGDKAKQFMPYSSRDSNRPEDLWAWLESTSARLGIDFVSIPHNSNLSNGLMFDMVDSGGRPITAEYARTRMRWEPVVEIAQIKGASEIHPSLSPNDEFANYEIYQALLTGGMGPATPADYLRTALMRGLEIEGKVGVNPYKFGIEGGTDSHTGLSSAEENNFFGKSIIDGMPAAGPQRMISTWQADGWDFAAQGMTGVWATENTRPGITAAFKRKEVYATTGTRISLRVFGGFNFAAADATARDLPETGYRKGVPMGGDIAKAPANKKASLLIHAVKDPIGANLDRVQVVKGWLDKDGKTHEKVYDVAWSGSRKPGADGKLPPVGNTVDLKTVTYTNSIGSAQLATVWTDPDFNPSERAFYYVRVLEIPTPRHSAYDAVALGKDPATAHARPATIQERAFSSPIWYTP
jgi:hypothetical protein